ncbi:MAG: hypothetical protein KDE19_22495, partial [Caldilineaceae bacterium]|nr:hypothetical protein [Caldilineaceae bacterium]
RTPTKTNYGCGETVQLRATADANWTFIGWSGALSGGQNPATVTMNGSQSVTAIFKENKFTLALTKEGGEGGDDPGTTTTSPNGPYYEGQQVTLSATPKAGYRFVKWVFGSTEYAEAEIDVTVSANATYTAVFAKIEGPTSYKIYMPIIAR